MIWDKANQFYFNERVLADAHSVIRYSEGNVGVRGHGLAANPPLWYIAQLSEAYNNLTSLRVRFQYHESTGDSTPGLSDSGWADILDSGVVLQRALTQGAFLIASKWPLLPDANLAKWLRTYVDVSGTSPTTGRLTAFYTTCPPDQRGLARETVSRGFRLPTSVNHFPGPT